MIRCWSISTHNLTSDGSTLQIRLNVCILDITNAISLSSLWHNCHCHVSGLDKSIKLGLPGAAVSRLATFYMRDGKFDAYLEG